MNKSHALSMTALVVATFALPACAQSNVTIYGIVDAAAAYSKDGDGRHVTQMLSGQGSASRLGLRGTEDLGSGLRALFNIEGAINVDTGTGSATGGGFAWQRQSWVGVAGSFGQVTLGRQFRPEARAVFAMDPFDAGSVASPPNTYSDTVFRSDNAVIYETPRLSGFVGRVMAVPGEGVAGRDLGASLQYFGGPLYLAYGYDTRKNVAGTDSRVWNSFGGSYDFNVVKLYAAFRTRKEASAGIDERSYWVGLDAPIGLLKLQAIVARVDDRLAPNRDASGFGLGAEYLLSKRTDLYARYGSVKNKNGATFGLGTGIDGSHPSSAAVGVRHRF